MSDLIPYLLGLALGEFDAALKALLGEEATVLADTVARLKERWQLGWEGQNRRSLEGLKVVFL